MEKSFLFVVALASIAGVDLVGQEPATQVPDEAEARAYVERLLKKHAFFAQVDYEVDTRHAPFVFCVERPTKAEPGYLRRVVNAHSPYLKELAKVFEQDYAKPLGLTLRPDMTIFPVAILNSRGSYGNYAQITGASSLHAARAHYDHQTRIAVSYIDAFSTADPGFVKDVERTALLHEVVHALQHAYARDGRMPRDVWFVEGLAEYRSVGGHLPEQLRSPRIDLGRLNVLGQALIRPDLQASVSPLADLFRAKSYGAVVEATKARAAAAGTPLLADEFVLEVFYAQAALFMRFLHEGDGGKLRPAALKLIDKLMSGLATRVALRHAFDGEPDLAELERQFRVWLTDTTRTHLVDDFPELAPRAPAAAGQPAMAIAKHDAKAFAWQPTDFELRLEAARQLCAVGDYDTALRVFPADDERPADDLAARHKRERDRVKAALALRDRVVADLIRTRAELELVLDGSANKTKAKVVARDATALRLLVDTTERAAPIVALEPTVLLQHCWRRSWLTGAERGLERWLRWLGGTPIEKLRPMLSGQGEGMAELRAELTTTFVPKPEVRAVVATLESLQTLDLSAEPAVVWKRAVELRDFLRDHGAHPAVLARRAAFVTTLQAAAERGMVATNVACLDLTGKVEDLGGGRFRVTYGGKQHAGFDMVPEHGYGERLPQPTAQIAYGGEPELRPTTTGWEIVGSGFFRWPLPLTGVQSIEVDQTRTAAGLLLVLCCDDHQGNHLAVDPAGIAVLDVPTRVADRVGDLRWEFFANRVHRLRIEHDGARKVTLARDGAAVAECTNPGGRKQGWIGLRVHASTPIALTRLVIEGQVDASAAPAIRQRWVERALATLPPAPKPSK